MGTIKVPAREQYNMQLMHRAAGKLAAKKPADEVIQFLCSTGDIYWEEARAIVHEVQFNRPDLIALHKLPGVALKSVLFAALGAFLLLLGGQVLLNNGLPTPLFDQLNGMPLVAGLSFYGPNRLFGFFNELAAGVGALLIVLAGLQLLMVLVQIVFAPLFRKSGS